MKEAAGEANLTVITIILIGVIAAVMTPIITGMLNANEYRSMCTAAGFVMEGGTCYEYRAGAGRTPHTKEELQNMMGKTGETP